MMSYELSIINDVNPDGVSKPVRVDLTKNNKIVNE